MEDRQPNYFFRKQWAECMIDCYEKAWQIDRAIAALQHLDDYDSALGKELDYLAYRLLIFETCDKIKWSYLNYN